MRGAGWILDDGQNGSMMGLGIAGVGDQIPGGNHEVLVGAPLWDNGSIDEGVAYLYEIERSEPPPPPPVDPPAPPVDPPAPPVDPPAPPVDPPVDDPDDVNPLPVALDTPGDLSPRDQAGATAPAPPTSSRGRNPSRMYGITAAAVYSGRQLNLL